MENLFIYKFSFRTLLKTLWLQDKLLNMGNFCLGQDVSKSHLLNGIRKRLFMGKVLIYLLVAPKVSCSTHRTLSAYTPTTRKAYVYV